MSVAGISNIEMQLLIFFTFEFFMVSFVVVSEFVLLGFGFVQEAKQTPKNAVAMIIFFIAILVAINIQAKVGQRFVSK